MWRSQTRKRSQKKRAQRSHTRWLSQCGTFRCLNGHKKNTPRGPILDDPSNVALCDLPKAIHFDCEKYLCGDTLRTNASLRSISIRSIPIRKPRFPIRRQRKSSANFLLLFSDLNSLPPRRAFYTHGGNYSHVRPRSASGSPVFCRNCALRLPPLRHHLTVQK